MEKRIKLKLSRVITSFSSCRSKEPSSLPSNPVPSFLRLSPIKLRLPPPPSSKPHHSFMKRHVSSAFASISCAFRSRSNPTDSLSETHHTKSPPPEFHWKEEEKWHVVAKIFDDTTPRRKIYNSLLAAPPPAPNTERTRRRVKRMAKTAVPRFRNSTSSAESGLISSEVFEGEAEEDERENEGETETETLVSSIRSFSSDYSSPEFSISNRKIHGCYNKKVKKAKRHRVRKSRKSRERLSSPARLSRFQWLLPCAVEGKVRESFAVVKKSEDPYEDFKRSMMEMIMEKEMFEVEDLAQLLQCFLSLNSRDYHDLIVQAFSEIWENLFSNTTTYPS